MKKILSSHISIIGLFCFLVLILAIPLIIFVSREKQDIRQRAAAIQPASNPPPPQQNGYISGYVYFDQNQDGQRDYAEAGVAGTQLKITQTNKNAVKTYQTLDLITAVVTDGNGYFKYNLVNPEPASTRLNGVEGLTFTVQLYLPEGYKTINSNPRSLSQVTSGAREIIEFGIFPVQSTSPNYIPPQPASVQPTIFQYLQPTIPSVNGLSNR